MTIVLKVKCDKMCCLKGEFAKNQNFAKKPFNPSLKYCKVAKMWDQKIKIS